MKALFHRMMAGAAYVLFVASVVIFLFSLLTGFLLSFHNPAMLFTTISAAFYAAGIPFICAAFLYRIDIWLGSSK
jgi:hypothetical protein